MTAPGWPAVLREGRVELRPLRRRDLRGWAEVRRRNAAWLSPWEATVPGADWADGASPTAFLAMQASLAQQARSGLLLPFVITVDGFLAGQLTLGGVVHSALNSAFAGYWVDEAVAGQGVAPTALALAVDHALGPVGLHRVEATIRPENTASRRVVEKLGFREEGLHRRYLHIDGAYRDHVVYAVTKEDVGEPMITRWRHAQGGA